MSLKIKIYFLLIATFSYGQSYRPLLDNSNQWHFTTCNSGCLTDLYYTNGDTIVNGLNHKVLDGFHYQSRTFLLREEVLTKKVYLKKINGSSFLEYLLYDFSLNEGAIFNMNNPLSPFPLRGGSFVLDSIRMKPLVNSINYKHFYFSPTPSNTISTHKVVWIEGLGSMSIINAPGGDANINGVGHLSCFYKNQELVYSQLDSISGCAYQTLSINEIHNYNFQNLKLYLSLKNKFILENSLLITSFEIFDITGRRIKRETNLESKTIEIDATEYAANIYFLVVFDKYFRRKSFKLIVQ